MMHSPGPQTTPAVADDAEQPEPRPLRRLRLLVTALVVVLILGMITVAGTLVIRIGGLAGAGGPGSVGAAGLAPIAAPELALPEGHAVTALGRAGAEILVLTRDPGGGEALRSFDAATGAARAVTPVRRTPAP